MIFATSWIINHQWKYGTLSPVFCFVSRNKAALDSPCLCPQAPFCLWARSTSRDFLPSLLSSWYCSVVDQHWKHFFPATHEHTQTLVETYARCGHTLFVLNIAFYVSPFSVMHNMLCWVFCRLKFPAVLNFCLLLFTFLKDFECHLCVSTTLEWSNRFVYHVGFSWFVLHLKFSHSILKIRSKHLVYVTFWTTWLRFLFTSLRRSSVIILALYLSK